MEKTLKRFFGLSIKWSYKDSYNLLVLTPGFSVQWSLMVQVRIISPISECVGAFINNCRQSVPTEIYHKKFVCVLKLSSLGSTVLFSVTGGTNSY